ncbi:MAG: hypothetical protein MZV63_26715 [Marinilabiliales bacterium]|nr:hypothetical protein [Marinilabiliales bacterium]
MAPAIADSVTSGAAISVAASCDSTFLESLFSQPAVISGKRKKCKKDMFREIIPDRLKLFS